MNALTRPIVAATVTACFVEGFFHLAKKRKMCSEKTFIRNERDAWRDALKKNQRPYKCDYCVGYHLTTQQVFR